MSFHAPGPARSFRPFGQAQLAAVAVAIPAASFLLASLIAALLLQAPVGDEHGAGGPAETVFELSSLLFEALLLAMTVAVAYRRETPWTGHGIAWVPWPKDRSFLPFIALMLAWQAVEGFLIAPRFPQLADFAKLPLTQPAATLALMTFVLSPVAEEVFFRGLLYTHLRAHAGFPATILLTALYFSLLHFDSSLLLPILALPYGLMAGLARERYGSVRPAIYLHLVWNLIAFGVDYFQAVPQ